ncbi:N-acetylmuramoyl-L-alanine amidase [Nocardioides zeae]
MVSDNLSGPTRTSRPSRRALIAGAGVAGAGLAAAASVATAGPAAARGPALTAPRPAAGPAALRMASAGDGGLRRASVRLGLTGRGRRSATVAGDPFSSVALTWRSGSPALSLRVRGLDGVWQPWQAIGHLHDGPTVGTAEWRAARRTSATGLTWVGDADAIEVAADGPVADLRVEMLDAAAAELPEPAGGVSARTAPMSRVYTRASWGADESLRTGSPTYLDHLQQVHVHHTAGANSYAVDDVPRLLRSMLAYHTQTLGWSDIGYNLLVDRFGRAFEGRAGGAKRLVRGAHTLGFNHTSCGIALMGNYETARPRVPRCSSSRRWPRTSSTCWGRRRCASCGWPPRAATSTPRAPSPTCGRWTRTATRTTPRAPVATCTPRWTTSGSARRRGSTPTDRGRGRSGPGRGRT